MSSTTRLSRVAYLPEIQTEFGSGLNGEFDHLEDTNWGSKFDGVPVRIHPILPDSTEWKVPYSPIKNRTKNWFNTGVMTRNGVTAAGGNQLSNFYMSLDHSKTNGIVPKDTYKRTNLRLKASQKVGKLRLSGNFSLYKSC